MADGVLGNVSGATAAAAPLTPTQLSALLDRVISDDFDGRIEGAATVLDRSPWTAFGAPSATQHDIVGRHSASHPGGLYLQLHATNAHKTSVYRGPFDFSKVKGFGCAIMIPVATSELVGCTFGVGLAQDATDLADPSVGRLWNTTTPSVSLLIRSAGASFGNWQLHTTAGTSPATSSTTVVPGTWYELAAINEGAGVYRIYVNGITGPTRSLVPTSGLCHLAIGGNKAASAAGAAGAKLAIDHAWVWLDRLDRTQQ